MLAAAAPLLSLVRLPGVNRQILARRRNNTAIALGLAFCAVPLSIAVAETLLVIALIIRLADLLRGRTQLRLPAVFGLWLAWALLEVAVWLHSPVPQGLGEIRHLFLIAALFLLVSALDQGSFAVTIWRGIFASSTLCCLALIAGFFSRLVRFQDQISTTADPSYYLRSGGLLNHWMIFGTVEVMVFAALLEYWQAYAEHRGYLLPLFGIHIAAITLSLTRMLWVCCLVLLFAHLARQRSKWIFFTPVLPAILFVLIPGPIRTRASSVLDPSYYSNAERVQMLSVGARMIYDHPWAGVGPGRVDGLYRTYLQPQNPVPAYHGHLHNNAFQLAAEFGLPVLGAAVAFVVVLFRRLTAALRASRKRESLFLTRTGLAVLAGFLAAGMFDYTYGHSLGLILLSFAALTPLALRRNAEDADWNGELNARGAPALVWCDRIGGLLLSAASLAVLIPAAVTIRVLSRRSPFIAHLRIGKEGCLFWVWKLRTMWPRDQAPTAEEGGWVQRIDCFPQSDRKPQDDPRISSEFARFCRRYSIDELPQFFHVLCGQMSLVGPRPLTREELRRHYGPGAGRILAVKPGLTGYWQTRGRNRLSYPERVALDLKLVRDLSAAIYFQLLLRTIPQVLRGENAW